MREFLIEPSLAQTDFPDFGKQMLEVVFSDEIAVLHPLLVHHIAANRELSQDACAPMTELCRAD